MIDRSLNLEDERSDDLLLLEERVRVGGSRERQDFGDVRLKSAFSGLFDGKDKPFANPLRHGNEDGQVETDQRL